LSHLQKKKKKRTVSWDFEGVMLSEFLPLKATINRAKHCEILKQFGEAIKRKRPE
jgi:hypothetical protein